jgi:hypothetical protein
MVLLETAWATKMKKRKTPDSKKIKLFIIYASNISIILIVESISTQIQVE